jgi:hypothetical protein
MSLSLAFLVLLGVGVIFLFVIAIVALMARPRRAGAPSTSSPGGNAAFAGRVANFQTSTEEAVSGNMKATEQVWDFEVQHRNEAGDVDRSMSVQMVGRSFDGRIRNDEDVAIQIPRGWRAGTTAHVDSVWSESRQVWVTSRRGTGGAPLACVIPFFVVIAAGFIAFALLAFKILTTINGSSP